MMDDVDRAAERRWEERQRRQDLLCLEAFGLLRRLVRMQGNGELEYDAAGETYCLFCFADPSGEHEDDCLYLMAQQLLRETEGP